MSHKSERQRRNRNQRRRAKAKKIAKVITTDSMSPGQPLRAAADIIRANNNAPRLLKKAADALNVLRAYGIEVQLAHDAIITDHGYVLPIGNGGEDVKWQVRTKQLTTFPLLPASIASEDDS